MIKYLRKLLVLQKNRENNLKLTGCSIANGCSFGKYNTVYDKTLLSGVSLGDFTYISHDCQFSNTKLGKFCSVGPYVVCGLGNHPTEKFVSTHPIFFSTKEQAQITFSDKDYFSEDNPIEIGNDVWICARSIILDGVKIGDGAIIAAGSVVNKDVPPYAIMGGVPAKLIRYRFDENTIMKLLKIKWWNKDHSWLKKNFRLFHDVKALIKDQNE